MLHTEIGDDLQLIRQIVDHISFKGEPQMTVEAIQDAVELELMNSSRKDVAQNTSLTVTNAALPVKRKRATCSWRLSISNRTISPVRMRI